MSYRYCVIEVRYDFLVVRTVSDSNLYVFIVRYRVIVESYVCDFKLTSACGYKPIQILLVVFRIQILADSLTA